MTERYQEKTRGEAGKRSEETREHGGCISKPGRLEEFRSHQKLEEAWSPFSSGVSMAFWLLISRL